MSANACSEGTTPKPVLRLRRPVSRLPWSTRTARRRWCWFATTPATPFPPGSSGLGWGRWRLSQHIAWDIGAARVARLLAGRLDAPGGAGRLFAAGDRLQPSSRRPDLHRRGQRWNRGSRQSESRRCRGGIPAERGVLALPSRDYPDAGAPLATRPVAGSPALIAIHSFTPVMNRLSAGRGSSACCGIAIPRLALPLLARLPRRIQSVVRRRQPALFRAGGRLYHGHARWRGGPAARGDRNTAGFAGTDGAGCARWATVVGDALVEVLRDETLCRVQHH
jgi:predicted N-formylglutamate amidohydrolase